MCGKGFTSPASRCIVTAALHPLLPPRLGVASQPRSPQHLFLALLDSEVRIDTPHHLPGCCNSRMEMITPKDYVGGLIELAQQRRGEFIDMKYMTEARTTLVYDMPLAEARFPLCSRSTTDGRTLPVPCFIWCCGASCIHRCRWCNSCRFATQALPHSADPMSGCRPKAGGNAKQLSDSSGTATASWPAGLLLLCRGRDKTMLLRRW